MSYYVNGDGSAKRVFTAIVGDPASLYEHQVQLQNDVTGTDYHVFAHAKRLNAKKSSYLSLDEFLGDVSASEEIEVQGYVRDNVTNILYPIVKAWKTSGRLQIQITKPTITSNKAFPTQILLSESNFYKDYVVTIL